MKHILLAAVVLILIGGGIYLLTPQLVHGPTQDTSANPPAQTTEVKIALLNTTGSGAGKARGCDTVVMATRTIPITSAPLTAAINALYAEPEGTQPSAQYNFIARTKASLKFDHATVEAGTANLYFTGSLSGLAGVCDDPRASIQFEETALQFPTVSKVQFYLNGTKTTLIPSEQ